MLIYYVYSYRNAALLLWDSRTEIHPDIFRGMEIWTWLERYRDAYETRSLYTARGEWREHACEQWINIFITMYGRLSWSDAQQREWIPSDGTVERIIFPFLTKQLELRMSLRLILKKVPPVKYSRTSQNTAWMIQGPVMSTKSKLATLAPSDMRHKHLM